MSLNPVTSSDSQTQQSLIPNAKSVDSADAPLTSEARSRESRDAGGMPPPAGDAWASSTLTTAVEAACPLKDKDETPTPSLTRPASLSDAKPTRRTSQSTSDGDDSSSGTKKKPAKLDRSKLRKGKWTVEEEEFASRIIQYFSTGLLNLPDGKTLRSYLADTLNCDPMRITKKFAGASCLGKRVYHLCDRTRHAAADVELAKAELVHLEKRYHLRVEHGQVGLPLPSQADLLPALPGAALFSQGNSAAALATSAWLQNIASMSGSASAPACFGGSAAVALPPMATLGQQMIAPSPVSSAPSPAAPLMSTLAPSGTNDAIASLAWAQAVSSLTPALSQLAAANMQHHQKQLQTAVASQLKANLQQEQLRIAYEAHLQTKTKSPEKSTVATAPPAPMTSMSTSLAQPTQVKAHRLQPQPPVQPVLHSSTHSSSTKMSAKPGSTPLSSPTRSKEDEDAGSMLLGFISSLRQSFEEAKERRKEEEVIQSGAETSSGTTTNPTDSSFGDSDLSENDKGKDISSASEESDKEASGEGPGRGPPRKRLKTRHSDFTRRNVAEHTTRMDALHAREEKRDSPEGL